MSDPTEVLKQIKVLQNLTRQNDAHGGMLKRLVSHLRLESIAQHVQTTRPAATQRVPNQLVAGPALPTYPTPTDTGRGVAAGLFLPVWLEDEEAKQRDIGLLAPSQGVASCIGELRERRRVLLTDFPPLPRPLGRRSRRLPPFPPLLFLPAAAATAAGTVVTFRKTRRRPVRRRLRRRLLGR